MTDYWWCTCGHPGDDHSCHVFFCSQCDCDLFRARDPEKKARAIQERKAAAISMGQETDRGPKIC